MAPGGEVGCTSYCPSRRLACYSCTNGGGSSPRLLRTRPRRHGAARLAREPVEGCGDSGVRQWMTSTTTERGESVIDSPWSAQPTDDARTGRRQPPRQGPAKVGNLLLEPAISPCSLRNLGFDRFVNRSRSVSTSLRRPSRLARRSTPLVVVRRTSVRCSSNLAGRVRPLRGPRQGVACFASLAAGA